MRFARFNMFPLPDFFRKTKTGISIWPSERPWNEKLFDTNSHAIFGIHKEELPRNDLKDFGEDYNKDEVVELRMRIP